MRGIPNHMVAWSSLGFSLEMSSEGSSETSFPLTSDQPLHIASFQSTHLQKEGSAGQTWA